MPPRPAGNRTPGTGLELGQFVEELAVHPDYQGRGVGGFILEQLQVVSVSKDEPESE